ncbi:family 1 glycosylhydrolase [Conexibacter woesei]|uniref:family 1 glycosylhydrolase n=1 Tax=Conexibacter woesei TaxID=191495 RepID=UPI0009D6560E
MSTDRFPDGFLWRAGTSAYRIEGSSFADGAGMMIQHRFAHAPGNVMDGTTALAAPLSSCQCARTAAVSGILRRYGEVQQQHFARSVRSAEPGASCQSVPWS